jgi:hypothetical protein
MKRLVAPQHDDAGGFEALANNDRVGSFPRFRPIVADIQESYVQYAQAGAHGVDPLYLSQELSDLLKGHFRSPPKDVAYIRSMRAESRHRTCPMCGSFHSGTLDHYLPQHDFPEFSLFSRNLVPACVCNSYRRNLLEGQGPGERVLHPYYDDCLTDRLVRAKFEDPGEVPRVSVVLTVPDSHPNYAAIAFHCREILQKTGVCGHLRDEWSKLLRRPSLAVGALVEPINHHDELRQLLELELDRQDDSHGSRNNWQSMFIAGLLDPPILRWLFAQLTRPGRYPDEPLIVWNASGRTNFPT